MHNVAIFACSFSTEFAYNATTRYKICCCSKLTFDPVDLAHSIVQTMRKDPTIIYEEPLPEQMDDAVNFIYYDLERSCNKNANDVYIQQGGFFALFGYTFTDTDIIFS